MTPTPCLPETVTIWANDELPPNDIPVLLWDSFPYAGQHPNTISLPIYVEENAASVRSHLLVYLSDLKNIVSKDKSIEETLRSRDGFSMWWMTSALLKRLGDPNVPFACRIIAVEQLVGASNFSRIRVECNDRSQRRLIKSALGQHTSMAPRILRLFLNYVFRPLMSLGSLVRYQLHTFGKIHKSLGLQAASDRSVVFLNYFNPAEVKAGADGQYVSKFWGPVSTLISNPVWLHLPTQNISRRYISASQSSIRLLNLDRNQNHSLFLQRIRGAQYREVVNSYFRNVKAHLRVDRVVRRFSISPSGARLWWCFQDSWDKALCSTSSMRHVISSITIKQMCEQLPPGSTLYYPLEFQPWESALTFHARRIGGIRLVGVAHSTVRFWDVRYFFEPQEASRLKQKSLPGPDQILVNGPINSDLLVESGIDRSLIAHVEALRYLYLLDVKRKEPKDLVILSDFEESLNIHLLKTCESALQSGAWRGPIRIRSHPIFPLTPNHLGSLAEHVSDEPLVKLLSEASVVITTAASSSAADAVSLGIPTILIADPRSLNFSPFRSDRRVFTVHSSDELTSVLSDPATLLQRFSFTTFHLDRNLPLWKSELGI